LLNIMKYYEILHCLKVSASLHIRKNKKMKLCKVKFEPATYIVIVEF